MKPKIRYLSVKDISGYPYSRKISESGNSSGEYFKNRLITALESDATFVCMNIDNIIIPGASWFDEIFGTMNNVQKELVQQKLYVKTQYEFIRGLIELRLGFKLVKHYEIQHDLEITHRKKSEGWFKRLLRNTWK